MINAFISLPLLSHFLTLGSVSMTEDRSPTGIPGVGTQKTTGKKNAALQGSLVQHKHLLSIIPKPVYEAVNYTRLPNKESFREHTLCKQTQKSYDHIN